MCGARLLPGSRTASGAPPDSLVFFGLGVQFVADALCLGLFFGCVWAGLRDAFVIIFTMGYGAFAVFRSLLSNLAAAIRFWRARQNFDAAFPPVDSAVLEEAGAENALCGVCLGPVTAATAQLPCGHLFHRDCLRSWVSQNSTCPYCFAPFNIQRLARQRGASDRGSPRGAPEPGDGAAGAEEPPPTPANRSQAVRCKVTVRHMDRWIDPTGTGAGPPARNPDPVREAPGVWVVAHPEDEGEGEDTSGPSPMELALAVTAYAQLRFNRRTLPPPPRRTPGPPGLLEGERRTVGER